MPDLDDVARKTVRLWRRQHLDYAQTKYVVEQTRRWLALEPPRERKRTMDRLTHAEVENLIQTTYQAGSKYGLMIKTLFQTGCRVDEFIHIRVEDCLLDGEPAQIHITRAKRQSDRYVPVLPALADEPRTHLNGRQLGFLFESNRHTGYSALRVQSILKDIGAEAGIAKRVYPQLLRHSVAIILLDSQQVPDRPGAEIPRPPESGYDADLCGNESASPWRKLRPGTGKRRHLQTQHDRQSFAEPSVAWRRRM